jgi:hypothetical protein
VEVHVQTETGGRAGECRGSILLIALVFVATMMIMALSFARGIHNNGAAMEQRIAAARALELAQGAGRMNLQQVYLD